MIPDFLARTAKAVVGAAAATATLAAAVPDLSGFPIDSVAYLAGWSAETTRHVAALVGWVAIPAGVWIARNRPPANPVGAPR